MTERGIYLLDRAPTQLAFYGYDANILTSLSPLANLPQGFVGLSVPPDETTRAFVRQIHKAAGLWMVDSF
jgi:hypothetical protein